MDEPWVMHYDWMISTRFAALFAFAVGIALSFCDASEIATLKEIEKLIRHPLPVADGHAYHSTTVASLHTNPVAVSKGAAQWRSFSPARSRGRRAR